MDAMSSQAVGKRLRLLRSAKGIESQDLMAQLLGVGKNRYNNWETGDNNIPVPFAVEVCKITGADLDYIYCGDKAGLPFSLAQALSK
jgi:transcriptional regulator with XRE-family HTH domain